MNPSGADPTSSQSERQVSDQWDPERVPVEELAAEFADRRRRGERATVEEYAEKHPDLAEEIRELFPAVLAMEKLNQRAHVDYRPSHQEISVEQLGDFRVISEVARGGMGIVYEAEQVTLGRRVAVKVLPAMALRSEKDVLRFHREARTSAKLHHTNIVPVFGVGEQDGMHYIVMQFIHGVGLDEIRSELRRLVVGNDSSGEEPSTDRARSSYIKRNAAALLSEKMRRESSSDSSRDLVDSTPRFGDTTAVDDNPADEQDASLDAEKPAGDARAEFLVRIDAEYWRNVARIGMQSASALQYAHAHGTLHRDVKPGNLLLDGEGVVWVADFGLAKAVEQDDVTWTGDIVGTLGYMAPERFHGQCDERSDIYGLGLTLYELLTFERAYEGPDRVALMHRVAHSELPPPRRQNPAIPLDLETIVMKAASKNPDDRYQSAADFASDLQNFLEDRPIQARRAHWVEQAVRWCRRNRAVAGLAATVAMLLVLVSLVASWGYVRESRQRLRAEATSHLAVDALERIYSQFAPNQLPTRVDESPDEADDEQSLLEVNTQLPLSKNVAELLDNLLEFYDQLSKQTEDQGVLLKSIMANRRVADIQFRLGQHDTARASYERAIERAKRIDAVTEPITLELARIHNGLGAVRFAQRDRDDAIAAHQQALALLEPHANSLDGKYEIARTLYLLHQSKQPPWWRRGRQREPDEEQRAEEKQVLDRAVALLKGLSADHKDVPEYRFLLAKCYRAQSEANGDEKDTADKSVELLKQLVRQHPDVADYRYVLGDAYSLGDYRRLRRDDWHWSAEELAKAEQRMRKGLEVTSDIELTHPSIPQYLDQKTRLHYGLAQILQRQSQYEEASQEYSEAIGRQAWAVRREPDDYRSRVWLAWLRSEWAELLMETNQSQVACEQLKLIPKILGEPGTEKTDSRYVKRMAERIRDRSNDMLEEARQRRTGE